MSIDVKNRRFMPHFKALLLDPGAVPGLFPLDLRSTRPELLTIAKALAVLNGDTLKSAKISQFARSAPFCQIRSYMHDTRL